MKRSPINKRRGVRRGPWRSEKYRRWVSEHLSILNSDAWPGYRPSPGTSITQAAHTQNNGTSSKGPDSSCLPLTPFEHADYDSNRLAFEAFHDLDMKAIAAQYFAVWEKEQHGRG